MAEEAKKENGKKTLVTLAEVILGLAFLVSGAWLVYRGWDYLLALVKGTVGLCFIFAGIILLVLARE